MNLAHFYSMIQFSGQKGSTSKKTATAAATATATTTNEVATTTTLTKATTTTTPASASASLSAPTKPIKISTTATATTNQLPPSVMTAATAAVGYSNGILYLPHDTMNNNNSNIIGNIINNHVVGDEGHEEDEDEDEENDETDSLASMETLSDNVSIWVDGEKHWVSGVDANTTCRDLINALLNYQDGPQMCSSNNSNNKGDNTDNIDNIDGIDSSNKAGGNSAINQSTLNTKEDEATAAGAAVAVVEHEADDAQKHRNADAFNGNDRRTCSNDAATYVIVRQHRHCEEFLDGSTKVSDLLPATRDAAGRREHQQLYLRRLTLASHVASNAPGLGSLLSTDKDSGMGSPVGSSRSARLRRKKHKSTVSWLAQGNTLHPKLSQRGSAANERLLKIILAQDETIHRQLTLLREKERQISKIEEENHRARERELGKNYLLETYLNGLDEAGTGADVVEGEEIFIDEPFVDYTRTTTTTATATKAVKQQQHQQERKSKRSSRHTKQPATQSKKEAAAAAATRTTTKSVTAIVTTAPDTPAAAAAVAGSQTDLEQQILWMEKLCSINKQLQREEELLLKLHSKIRKHHVKRAYHRKQQMLQQLDDLDSNITLQAVDIRKNEADLAASDEQLQQKVSLLDRLSLELEAGVCAEQQQKQTVLAMATTAIIAASPTTSTTTADVDLQQPGYQQLVPPASTATSKADRPTFEEASATSATTIAATEIATAANATRATTSTSEPRTRFTLDAMQLPEDLLSWQQLIAKPQVLSTTPTTAAAGSKAATVAAVATTAVVSATNAATNYEQRINHASNATATSSSNVALQLQQRHQQQHLNDKLHALHMKTVKKQMFSPKAVVSNAPVVGVPSAAAPTACRPPPTEPQPQPQPTLLFLADTLDFTQIGTLV